MLHEVGRNNESRKLLREAARLPIVDNWRELADLDRYQHFADALTRLASMQVTAGLLGEAETAITQAAEIQDYLLIQNSQSSEYRRGKATIVAVLGQAKMWWGRVAILSSRYVLVLELHPRGNA